jgi:hypothetical protein
MSASDGVGSDEEDSEEDEDEDDPVAVKDVES